MNVKRRRQRFYNEIILSWCFNSLGLKVCVFHKTKGFVNYFIVNTVSSVNISSAGRVSGILAFLLALIWGYLHTYQVNGVENIAHYMQFVISELAPNTSAQWFQDIVTDYCYGISKTVAGESVLKKQ